MFLVVVQVLCGQGQVSVVDRMHWTFHFVLYYTGCIVQCIKSVWILKPLNPVDWKVRWWDDISLDRYMYIQNALSRLEFFLMAVIKPLAFLFWLRSRHNWCNEDTGQKVTWGQLFLHWSACWNIHQSLYACTWNCFSVFLVFNWCETLQWLRYGQ